MARIDLEGDYSDPYKNYAGGSSSFDEKAYAQPAPSPSQELPAPPGRPTGDQGYYIPQMRAPDENNDGGTSPSPYPTPQPNAPNVPSGGNGGLPSMADIEKQLQGRLGGLYDKSILGDVVRNTSYENNQDSLQGWIDRVVNKNLLRGSNETNSSYTPNGQGGFTTGPTGRVNMPDPRAATSMPSAPGGATSGGASYSPPGLNYPGSQFSDPYTKLLEDIAHNQLNLLQGNNPQTQQLMDFINKQFTALSNSNGYTPDELALLRTQAMEPITAGRDSAQQRELVRTSRAGYLPTSGITLDQQRQIDTDFGQQATAASRDLAINGINRQDQQRNQAIQLGQLGMQIPQQQGTQALDVAGMLYQLPRQAMMDANTIVNGSAPQNVLSPYIQLMQQQQQQQYLAQQQQQQFWENIGSQLAHLFGG